MGLQEFEFIGSPARIVFGRGSSARASEAIEALNCKRALVLSTDAQKDSADKLACSLGRKCLGVYAKAAMHTPVEVTAAAMEVVETQRVDCLVSYGGGSTTGLGKAIAYRTDLPHIAIPTTYAGSEVTPILGQTENGRKTTLRSDRVLPEMVLYDPDLTFSLPLSMSVTSGINAIAHGVEALYARDRNPISTMMAAEGIRALCAALPDLVRRSNDPEARDRALYGAWLCGAVLGQVGMALHHKLCHALGGLFDLPHAETHAVILPHATAFNAAEVPDLLRPVAAAVGADRPGRGLYDLATRLGAPVSPRDLGMPKAGIDRAAEQALANPYWNPRPFQREDIAALLRAAYFGEPAQE
ncbi:MAG: maleylacetate reductase [Pseudomonadota bacterium]